MAAPGRPGCFGLSGASLSAAPAPAAVQQGPCSRPGQGAGARPPGAIPPGQGRQLLHCHNPSGKECGCQFGSKGLNRSGRPVSNADKRHPVGGSAGRGGWWEARKWPPPLAGRSCVPLQSSKAGRTPQRTPPACSAGLASGAGSGPVPSACLVQHQVPQGGHKTANHSLEPSIRTLRLENQEVAGCLQGQLGRPFLRAPDFPRWELSGGKRDQNRKLIKIHGTTTSLKRRPFRGEQKSHQAAG